MAKSDQKAEVAESGNDQNQNQETQNANNQEMKQDEIKPPNREDWRDAKWITYKDKKNGFEVKYPDSFSLNMGDNSKCQNQDCRRGNISLEHKDTLRYIREINYGAAQIDYSVYILVRDNKENLSLYDWILKNNHYYSLACNNDFNKNRTKCEDGGMYPQVKVTTINNKKAILIEEYSIGDNSIILFSLKNKIVQFYLNGGSIDFNNGDNFFKKMMESFKIIK